MASAAALLRALLLRRLARTAPLSATNGHLRSESHHQRREQRDFIPLRIGPGKYAAFSQNGFVALARVAPSNGQTSSKCNYRKALIRTFGDWYDPIQGWRRFSALLAIERVRNAWHVRWR